MPRVIDATVWLIRVTRRGDWESILPALARLVRETPQPSPDNLEAYDRHWGMVASKLACEFGFNK